MAKQRSKRVPEALASVLDAHLDAHFRDAPSGVHEAARDALRRRWDNAVAGQLMVMKRPARRGAGRYHVSASGGESLYEVLARGVSPLDVACSCADHRSGGLGVSNCPLGGGKFKAQVTASKEWP